jgi:hypothetical protein
VQLRLYIHIHHLSEELDATILIFYAVKEAHAVAQLVDALRHKPEGCGSDSR